MRYITSCGPTPAVARLVGLARLARLVRLLSLGLAIALVPAPARAITPFLTELVDDGEFLGQHTSLAIDANGDPHISYHDVIAGRLKYATKNGEVWTLEVADDPAIEVVGSYTSIALDADGDPHITYYDISAQRLKYAFKDAGVWNVEIVDDPAQDVGKYSSMELASNGQPHVAYYDDTLNRLKYAFRLNNGTWIVQVVDDPVNDVGQFCSLALDAFDGANIAYLDATDQEGKFAVNPGGGWEVVIFRSSPGCDGDIDLDTDAAGRAHIAYRNGGLIVYAKDDDYPSFDSENVGGGNGDVSIVADPSGRVCVSYRNSHASGDNLVYAARNGPDDWSVEVVDRAGDVGNHTSIALDRQGNPRISYHDEGSGHLRYADASIYVREPLGGDSWPVGAVREVRWDGVGPIDVHLSVDGGRSWNPLFENMIDRRVLVDVPHAPTRFAKIRVARDAPFFATDESDSTFTIDATIVLMQLRVAPATRGVRLEWATVPGPEDLAGYRIERGLRGASAESWEEIAFVSGSTTYVDAGGAGSSRYRLHAVNRLGGEQMLGEAQVAPLSPIHAAPLPYRGGELLVTFHTAGGLGGGAGDAELALFDVSGRHVATLASGTYAAGLRSVTWDGRDASGVAVPSGTYLLRLTTSGLESSKKLVVVR